MGVCEDVVDFDERDNLQMLLDLLSASIFEKSHCLPLLSIFEKSGERIRVAKVCPSRHRRKM